MSRKLIHTKTEKNPIKALKSNLQEQLIIIIF
jgi:hypothetical protein